MLRLLEEKIVTPLGPLWVICDEQFRLRAVEWEEYSERMVQLLDIHYRKEGYERISATNPGGLSDKLREYFAGNLSIIDTLPTATGGDAISARSLENTTYYPLRAGNALRSTGRTIGSPWRGACRWCG
ncbi:methylated-DNA--protein-cysteine methyltransferase [Escherichia coli]|uniref:Methylated-DNA--protein-cysteine methyltransferase n=1 Tax=Escherichia coli TaxID=562 RepID=A0A376J7N7_ECOLX|nr:methylated-DNA--protein-cysteine methyltransferase [Escherichia coli]